MQKRTDLLDELGLVFIAGLENGNICMHFGFKTADAVTVVTLRLCSSRGGQSNKILGFGGD